MDRNGTIQNIQHALGSIFTKARLKKITAGAILCSVIAGGAACYQQQQEKLAHEQLLQARAAILESQAAQYSIVLLDTDTIRSLAAQTIGIDETAVTFREIALFNGQEKNDKDRKEKDRRDRKEDKREHEQPVTRQTAAPAPVFQPMYKVACQSGSLKYKLRIDAVSGEILQSKIEKTSPLEAFWR